MSGLTATAAAAGGANAGTSLTELAQQHGVSRESLVDFVQSKIQQSRQANGESPLDQSTLDQLIDHALDQDGQPAADGAGADAPASAGYTATAQLSADRPRVSAGISILA
jgi:hypothetical protein